MKWNDLAWELIHGRRKHEPIKTIWGDTQMAVSPLVHDDPPPRSWPPSEMQKAMIADWYARVQVSRPYDWAVDGL